MPKDRRCFIRQVPGRRFAFRSFMNLAATWRSKAADAHGECRLIEASESGLAVIAPQQCAPPVGNRFEIQVGERTWHRLAEVVRIEPVAGREVLVAAQFVKNESLKGDERE